MGKYFPLSNHVYFLPLLFLTGFFEVLLGGHPQVVELGHGLPQERHKDVLLQRSPAVGLRERHEALRERLDDIVAEWIFRDETLPNLLLLLLLFFLAAEHAAAAAEPFHVPVLHELVEGDEFLAEP